MACGTVLDGTDPVRIGLPLDGWDLAVVDAEGHAVAEGATGELIIGGVGLARYLDPDLDAAKFAPMPTLGWERAYRSGDMVRNDPAGLLFAGRADDQVKLGGRRIELGEIDGQLLRIPGVVAAAAAVRATKSGNKLLVGYLNVDASYDPATALELLRERMPAALVPRLAVVDSLPTRTSGKVDRDALPWPPPGSGAAPAAARDLSPTQAWIAEIWNDVLGAEVASPNDDFFDFGGGSLTAAQVVSRLRERYPEVVVGDVYAHSTIATLAAALEEMGTGAARSDRKVMPIPVRTQVGQLLALVPLRALAAARWLSWLALLCTIVTGLGPDLLPWLPSYPVWVLTLTTCVFLLPPGRMALAAGLARLLLRGVEPGSYPRGGQVHLRVWLASRVQDELAAAGLGGAPWFPLYARLLGAEIGKGADLHTLPPVTGMLKIGRDAAVEPEVDLGGYWIDGDVFHVGEIRIGARARIGARSMLAPGCPGAARRPRWPRARWSSAPSRPASTGRARPPSACPSQPEARGPSRRRPSTVCGRAVYALSSILVAALPGAAVSRRRVGAGPGRARAPPRWAAPLRSALPWLPLAALVGYAVLALLVLLLVRACSPSG